MSGQVELNPGPGVKKTVKYPCGICSNEVKDDHKGISCDSCSTWYHIDCTGMTDYMYDTYCNNSNLTWLCIRCGFPNISTGIFDSTLLSTSNSFELLDSSEAEADECVSNFQPTQASTPIKKNKCARTNKKLKVMVINCDGLHWPKVKAAFHASVEEHAPDIILGCESKLSPEMPTYSIFPENYNIRRKDRDKNGGGVFIAIKENLIAVDKPEFDIDCELTWSTLEFPGSGKLHLCSFYRPPSGGTEPLEKLCDSVNKVLNDTRTHTNGIKHKNILICGDFNLPDIDWDSSTVKPDSMRKGLHERALEILLGEMPIVQLQTKITRQASQNVLDLICTNNQNIVTNIQTHPGISDHDIVTCDINMSLKFKRKPPRKIFSYDKADTESLRSSLTENAKDFLASSPENNSVDTNWNKFKDIVNSHMDKFIPYKMSKAKQSFPWINQTIKREMRKRDRLYRKYISASPAVKPKLWSVFKKQRNRVVSLLRDSQNCHIKNVVGPSLDSNPKRFWTYVKSLRRESLGIPPLVVNNKVHSTDKGIAEALNDQFTSVFTKENMDSVPTKGKSSYNSINDLNIDLNGVVKQLSSLKCHKASGPDDIPAKFLHDYATEIGPIIHYILQQSYNSGSLPSDWKKALVTSIYKKGSKSTPENYRPVSLTCICCKIMEHIVLSHTAKHLAENNVIISNQHGFREKLSCETQLIQATHDWAEVLNRGGQTDVLLLDFSKAFDKVPHHRLSVKLDHYGIRGKTLTWIQSFLSGREQCVVVNGTKSKWSPVTSGVPQGSVLGPTLFLIYINDIASDVTSTLRLFADDSILYKEIKSTEDQLQLQNDLQKVFNWAGKWQMSFNASKCEFLQITRKTKPLTHTYTVDGQNIAETSKHKYLGVTINKHLDWKDHVQNTMYNF